MMTKTERMRARALARERQRRTIFEAALAVAADDGWAAFSLERVAQRADLPRSTIYAHYASAGELVLELAERALLELSTRLTQAESLAEAIDAPARLAREQRAAFSLLFPAEEHRYASPALLRLQTEAQDKLARLERLARRAGTALPEDTHSSAAFLRGISLASAVLPALRDSTTLRHRWQSFCLG